MSNIKVPIAKPLIDDEEIENVVEVLKSGMICDSPFDSQLSTISVDTPSISASRSFDRLLSNLDSLITLLTFA